MNKVIYFLNNAVNTVKQQIDEKRRKDAADEAWVESRPESQIISNYFRQFFDKNQPGYQFSKRIHRPIWINVLENAVELSWMPDQVKAQSFADVKRNCTCDKKLVSFDEIYRWNGGNTAEFYRTLSSAAMRNELFRIIMRGLETLPHLNTSNGVSVKLFH